LSATVTPEVLNVIVGSDPLGVLALELMGVREEELPLTSKEELDDDTIAEEEASSTLLEDAATVR